MLNVTLVLIVNANKIVSSMNILYFIALGVPGRIEAYRLGDMEEQYQKPSLLAAVACPDN